MPTKTYKIYVEKRPTNDSQPDHPFYIAATTVHRTSHVNYGFKDSLLVPTNLDI